MLRTWRRRAFGEYNVEVIGRTVDAIERGEDRIEFKHTMDQLGIEMARSEVAYSVDEASCDCGEAWISGSSSSCLYDGAAQAAVLYIM